VPDEAPPEAEAGDPVAMATLTSAAGFLGEVRAGAHRFVVDEGPEVGGNDQGPNPYQLLMAALCQCTAATLRMYGQRKEWELGQIRVRSILIRVGEGATKREHVERSIRFGAGLTSEQTDRLLEIADRTPVTRTLVAGLPIHTVLG
jgi:putative redox protein